MRIGTASGKPCRISTDSSNRSVCITGLSGTGKTVRLNQLELSALQKGASVLVLDVGHTHAVEDVFQPMRKNFSRAANYIDAKEGLGLGIFRTLETDQGKKEPVVQVVNSAVSALSAGQRMGPRQLGALRGAVIDVMKNRCYAGSEAEALESALAGRENDEHAAAVYQKLWTILHCGALNPASKYLQTGKINILDLSDTDTITQTALVELILHTLWRKIRFAGLQRKQQKITIVLDEFQNLPLKSGSLLCNMLREGRKFGVNFLLATQSLMSFPREVRPIIGQTATQLYFRPAPSEIKSIAKTIDFEKAAVWEKILSNLKVGECVAVGEFEVNGAEVKRPLKLSGIDF